MDTLEYDRCEIKIDLENNVRSVMDMYNINT